MTPAEITNPKRRLRARRRIAINRLADLRAEWTNPKPGTPEYTLLSDAKKTVTLLQKAKSL